MTFEELLLEIRSIAGKAFPMWQFSICESDLARHAK